MLSCEATAYNAPIDLPSTTLHFPSCHGLSVFLNSPSTCTSSTPCGFILDIHGHSMSGEEQAFNSGLFEVGAENGYVVAAPTSPYVSWEGPSWAPEYHVELLQNLLQAAKDDETIDSNRIHVTGFSQGGFLSWDLLCKSSEVVCSAAPLAASGRDAWGAGFGSNCFDSSGSGPANHRSVMFTIGRTDPLSSKSLSYDQFYDVAETYYGFKSDYPDFFGDYTVTTDNVIKMEYGEDGINVKFIDHNGDCTLYDNCGGHCFPTEPPSVCSASQKAYWVGTVDFFSNNHRCCVDGWSHGEEVVKFFKANTCDQTVADTGAPTPAPTNPSMLNGGGASAGKGLQGTVLTVAVIIVLCAYL